MNIISVNRTIAIFNVHPIIICFALQFTGKRGMVMEEKTLDQKIAYDGLIIHVREDKAQMDDGMIVNREVVEHPGGVGIALEDEDGTFFFVKQFRYAQQEVTIEFPAGKKEKGEDPLETAKREIIEETGYEGMDWKYLGKMYPTPAYDTEVIDLYYAKKGRFVGQHLDEDENLNVLKMTLEELTDKIVSMDIPDAKTMGMAFLVMENKKRGNL